MRRPSLPNTKNSGSESGIPGVFFQGTGQEHTRNSSVRTSPPAEFPRPGFVVIKEHASRKTGRKEEALFFPPLRQVLQ